ncbi:Probable ATP-dependent RNA helicase DDX11 [Strongyloides ratti]|uniref:Probable ATP-dependent RNA helicase DDX11 n=1 Tax=Strongyloides ratti TaxID=34506 RepID=A0A090LGS3_STRRB|nr:Probable ATP-dependent RNA helicase DDX11 [Strongyloides ratti]CEF69001.1 Probable ATP-dependent RNA helicase DDX11 [Strongyloides ratti]
MGTNNCIGNIPLPNDFSFPYQPYSIQNDLMKNIFECCEKGEVGILESPTGTGKSLSTLCSVLTWLRLKKLQIDNDGNELEKRIKMLEDAAKGNPNWIEIMKERHNLMKASEIALEKQEKMRKVNEILKKAKENRWSKSQFKEKDNIKQGKRKLRQNIEIKDEDISDDEFAPKEDEINFLNEKDFVIQNDEPTRTIQIIYASRTHSQLLQLLEELAKTKFEPNVALLRSRAMLCVNEDVASLGNISLINEKCNELMNNKQSIPKKYKNSDGESVELGSSKCRCPYSSQKAIEDLADQILNREGLDPETLLTFGKKNYACPYFATRKAIRLCDLVLTPYNILLNQRSREAWDLSLKDNIIIVDEAHNLLETISYIYSTEIDQKSLSSFISLLRSYYNCYEKRFNLKTKQQFRVFQKIINNMYNILNNIESDTNTMTTTKFLYNSEALDLNLFKIMTSFDNLQLWRKLHGFFLTNKSKNINIENKEESENKITQNLSSPVYIIKTFLESFLESHDDSLIALENTDKDTKKVKFFLLNPAEKLKQIVKEAKALILIGGTMKPIEQLLDAFERVCLIPKESIKTFSCGHVVDKSQLIAMVSDVSPDGTPLHFIYEERNNTLMFKGLIKSIIEIASVIPNGIVAFFPSYSYIEIFKNILKNDHKLFETLSSIKDIFYESKLNGSSIWNNYTTKALTKKGAILFGVIGGKLSEGINFSDKLGRGVIMIGLPFPNKNSIEILAKMDYLKKNVSSSAASTFYNSLCMHAVNQGIGRAIRHSNDYSTIIFLDKRYQNENIQRQLPNWIVDKIIKCRNFKDVSENCKKFFENKI